MSQPESAQDDSIAIIAMTGRFPGARNVEEFWRNLRDGVESISFLSDEELRASGVSEAELTSPNYIKARPVLDDIDLFDAEFFKLNPRETEMLDPQHRMFLECAWEVLESAGYDPGTFAGRIGVYAGLDANTYLVNNILSNPQVLASVNMTQNMQNDKDYMATRVSYKLNLKGPSVAVQTACSTALVAVHLACDSLIGYECDMALAGAISISVPQKAGYTYQEGGVLSPDGHCRAFDAAGQGTVFGSGVGIVVLRRLEDALANGDHILTVIRGSAINNDGALKIGYTAPSIDGQAAVVAEALTVAQVDPETIGYIETHGTATQLGDPIEVAALTRAFRRRTSKKGYCALGAVKTNVGHLSTAAGAAGLIKTVLALTHRQIPPSLNFQQPNPAIDFDNSPFFVNAELREWPATGSGPRRAGVSSFGMGGTNAHLVLEEAPALPASGPAQPWQLLLLSARTATSLEKSTDNVAEHLSACPDLNLADVAYTLQVGRRAFGYRRAVLAQGVTDALAALKTRDARQVLTDCVETSDRPIAFVFPGLGDQYPNMARGLYEVEPVFRKEVDSCAQFLRPYLGLDLRQVLFPPEPQPGLKSAAATAADSSLSLSDLLNANDRPMDEATLRLNRPSLAYPAIFVVEYALARLLMSWGVEPKAIIGHSIGEYVAACVSGVFSLEDALLLVKERGRMVETLPSGDMLAVLLSEQAIQPYLSDKLALSAINGPAACVVAGSHEDIAELEQALLEAGIACRHVQTTHAFHSPAISAIVAPLTRLIQGLRRQPPTIPYVSNLTGTWISPEQAQDPAYWARQMREPVRFADGIEELQKIANHILVEVGPGRSLANMRLNTGSSGGTALSVISLLRRPQDQQADQAYLLLGLGRLWLAGGAIDWQALHNGEQRHRVPLPTYPFERKRYWVEPGATPAAQPRATGRAALEDWFYIPGWKRTPPPMPVTVPDQAVTRDRWLVFADSCGLATELTRRLVEAGQDVTGVTPGGRYARGSDGVFTINPSQPEDYDLLVRELARSGRAPDYVLHLWSVTGPAPAGSLPFAATQHQGSYSILLLLQALQKKGPLAPCELVILSNGLHEITGDEELCPEKAPILALATILPQEYPQVSCRAIDLVWPSRETAADNGVVDRLVREILSPATDPVIAYRQKYRWTPSFDKASFSGAPPARLPLREEGAYLITGGLGQIGLSLARYLAQAVRARLVLVTDCGPSRAAIQDVEQGELPDGLVRELEELGGRAMLAAIDVADQKQVEALIQQVEAQYGKLHGVIHAAGTENDTLFQLIMAARPAAIQAYLRAKVDGLYALHAALSGRQLDFWFLSSSLATFLGGAGFAAYAAADLFLDAWAEKQNRAGETPWISVNWDPWQADPGEGSAALRPDLAQLALSATERGEVLRRILTAGMAGRFVVSSVDLAERIRQGRERMQALHDRPDAHDVNLHARPSLATDYVPPSNELERQIVAIWQQALGIQNIGIQDDFFALGGNSLLAVQVIFQLRQTLGVEVPMAELVKQPNIAFLASYIDTVRWVTTASQTQPAVQDEGQVGNWEEVEL